MTQLKRNCDKCCNKVGTYCTMHKDMEKSYTKLCDGFKVLKKKKKEIIVKYKPKVQLAERIKKGYKVCYKCSISNECKIKDINRHWCFNAQ